MEIRKWKKLGSVSVDSGMIAIGDPTYLRDGDHPLLDYDRLCDEFKAEFTWLRSEDRSDHWLIISAHADGGYPIEAQFTATGQIAELRIKFL